MPIAIDAIKILRCSALDIQSDIPGATIHTNRILLNWSTIFTNGGGRLRELRDGVRKKKGERK